MSKVPTVENAALARCDRRENATCCGKTRSALEGDRFQRSTTYLLHAVGIFILISAE